MSQSREPAAPNRAGWVDFEFDTPLENSTTYLLKGSIRDGECHFSGSGDVRSAVPIEERSLAINTPRCQMLVERGEAPAPDIHREGWHTAESDELIEEEARLAGQTGGDAATCCFQGGFQTGGVEQSYKGGPVRKFAYHKAYWEDPPQIDVNSVEAQVDWTSNGSCANLGTTRYRSHRGWFSASGWSQQWSSHNGSRACGYATTVSKARFFNGAFCANKDIWAHYDGAVSVSGRPDGRYNMSWDVWLETDSWLCGNLLSFHRSHGYFTSWGQNH